jgi:hypothetical protein
LLSKYFLLILSCISYNRVVDRKESKLLVQGQMSQVLHDHSPNSTLNLTLLICISISRYTHNSRYPYRNRYTHNSGDKLLVQDHMSQFLSLVLPLSQSNLYCIPVQPHPILHALFLAPKLLAQGQPQLMLHTPFLAQGQPQLILHTPFLAQGQPQLILHTPFLA